MVDDDLSEASDFGGGSHWLGEYVEYIDAYFARKYLIYCGSKTYTKAGTLYYIGDPEEYQRSPENQVGRKSKWLYINKQEKRRMEGTAREGDDSRNHCIPEKITALIKKTCQPEFDVLHLGRTLGEDEKNGDRFGPWNPRTREDAQELFARAKKDTIAGFWRARWNYAYDMAITGGEFEGQDSKARNYVILEGEPLPQLPQDLGEEENPSIKWNEVNLLWYYEEKCQGRFPPGVRSAPDRRTKWAKLRYFHNAARVFRGILSSHGEGSGKGLLRALKEALLRRDRFDDGDDDRIPILREFKLPRTPVDRIADHLNKCGITKKLADDWIISYFNHMEDEEREAKRAGAQTDT